jgi:hypothetical protein
VAASVVVGLVLTMAPGSFDAASARPPVKPGRVTLQPLDATLDAHTYTVHASWNASSNTTAYQVRMTNASGTTLDQQRVTTPEFDGTTTMAAGAKVTVTVTPFNQKRRGRSASVSRLLPDLTAPVGVYTITPASDTGDVTLNQVSLTDDLSTLGNIKQHIDWDGDGTTDETDLGNVTSLDHSYGATPAVYHPVVTVSDQNGNDRSYELATSVGDHTAPSATASVAPLAAWAKWTFVVVDVSDYTDNLSASADLTGTIAWGDGTTDTWVPGSPSKHRYQAAGPYQPVVTIADEAGNTFAPSTAAVDVTADTVAPRVRLTVPARHRASVAKWTTLKGRTGDAGTGVRRVQVKAIEKRHGVWYGYRPGLHRWLVASSKAAAWTKATPAKVKPVGHVWSSPLSRLRTGLLITRVRAVDNVGNRSLWKQRQQTLTRP